ncbi:hypothetical protein BGZ83_012042 [Gryganskiella cystojenkinii]|nr:hypothetical protein BGZ83_012042 [Gryganskiella cystojenkinii]
MTQNYARMPMHQPNIPSNGMPIIPPRLQQQQQQQLLQQNRMQQQQQYVQFQSIGNNNNNNNPLPSVNVHVRSASNGSNRARPLYGNNSPTLNHSASSSRLRSESNPASYGSNSSLINGSNNYNNYNSNGNNNGYAQGHLRANSSGSNASAQSGRTVNSNNNSVSSAANSSLMSFQDRMKERDRERQQREREERDAAARAIREDPAVNQLLNQAHNATAAAAAAQPTTGAVLWNKLKAAKDVINTAITGEERWPDSDDSDHEGESHVSRILRDYFDKNDEKEMAAKIAALEMTPVSAPLSKSPSNSGSLGYTRDRLWRNASASRLDNSSSSENEYMAPSLRGRGGDNGGSGHKILRSEDNSRYRRPKASDGNNSMGRSISDGSNSVVKMGNRMRTSSDASRDEALSRLEGKRSQDAFVAQISHLGSTRARSPHRGQRAYRDNIDTEPPPPLPTPKSTFRQRQPLTPSASSPALLRTPSNNKDLGAYGQRLQQKQQQEQAAQQQQQQQYGSGRYM